MLVIHEGPRSYLYENNKMKYYSIELMQYQSQSCAIEVAVCTEIDQAQVIDENFDQAVAAESTI